VFPRSVILIAQELINFLCVVLNFLTKMYVQSMYMKCITNLILDLARMSTATENEFCTATIRMNISALLS
jgi:hypothetical protein